ncbi:hypothetical protein [Clavibacter capsici]|uniref:hypothetical protein n=1 Tax=Clavibacter capsici TaxID=1874630 RepID=UPI00287BA59B|nr:hypothetical protein [Clavibacter capsici]
MPAAFGVAVVRGFRRVTEMELDRVLVQSTVSAPRYAVGMLASEELARLDLAAEQLLDDVASGREPLPLSPLAASTAASLATELRLHLIEGRRETWLHHAVTESEFLGPDVTLSDPAALAGLLDRRQRDGLLSAVWLLLTSAERRNGVPGVSVQVSLGPSAAAAPGSSPCPCAAPSCPSRSRRRACPARAWIPRRGMLSTRSARTRRAPGAPPSSSPSTASWTTSPTGEGPH